jgi:tRNA threonylcarbamoyladenosine biosynthesis protein TsaB
MILGIDTTAPLISVAIGRASEIGASTVLPQRSASEGLLGSIRECLTRVDLELRDLSGIVCVAGPGSFTGIRIGLATVLALHEATGLRCAAVPTLSTLAWLPLASHPGAPYPPTLCAVDALRGHFFVQTFQCAGAPDSVTPVSEPTRVPEADLLSRLVAESIEFVAMSATAQCQEELGASLHRAGVELRLETAGLAAPTLAELAIIVADRADFSWRADSLCRPLYLQRPAVSRPKVDNRRPGG